jgi:PPP family 3-phenylpropionic acid transporter
MADQKPNASGETPPRAFAPRLSLSFAGAFLSVGILLPYFPIWLKSLDLADWQVGVLLSLPMLLRVVTTPIIAARADKARDRADVLLLMSVLCLASTGLLFVTDSFWPLLAVVLLQAVFAAPQVLLIDAITITGVRRYRTDYARVRLWGSLSFIVANLIGGALIASHGVAVVLPLVAASYAIMIAVSIATPRVGRPRRPSPLADLTSGGGAPRKLLRTDFLLLLSGGTLINASHAMLYGFSAIYWSDLGYSGTTVGILWALSVVGEVALFQFATRLIGRVPVRTIILVGGAAAAFRWLAFPLDFGLAWYIALQLLHAASFAAIHLAQQRLILERAGEEQEAAAQGLLFFLNGAGMGVFMLLSGYLFDAYGAASFIVMAIVAVSGIACHAAGNRLAVRQCRNDAA